VYGKSKAAAALSLTKLIYGRQYAT